MAPIATVAPVQRNRVLAFTSRLFRLFEDWELRPQHTNPARGIERAREEPRDRVLTPTQVTALGEALTHAEKNQPAAVAAIRFAALTGLRIGEVLSMRWEHIEEAHNAVILPRTKTGRRKHGLPSAALKLLADLPRINDYVFTIGNDARHHLSHGPHSLHGRCAPCRPVGRTPARFAPHGHDERGALWARRPCVARSAWT